MKKIFAATASSILLVIRLTAFSQGTSHTLILQPGPADGIDADIRTDLPQTPRGSSPDFIANAWTAQGNYFNQRSLLKFDLSQIPTEATVLNATLFLYTNLTTGHYQLDSGANASYLYRIVQPWQEDHVCWDNQPAISMVDPVFLPQSVTHTQSYELDVTSHVQNMVSNPVGNYGWLFRLQTEEMYRCMVFASSDHLNPDWRPKLVVQYRSCQIPVAGFTFTINSLEVQFTNTSTPEGAWQWTFGDGATSNEQNPVHTYSHPGSYQVCLEIQDSCGVSSYCSTVEVTCTIPLAGFMYDYSYTTAQFLDTSHCVNPVSWLWDFGDNTTSSLQNPVHVYNQIGSYEVCFTVADSCGSDQFCSLVGVGPALMSTFTSTQNESDNLYVSFEDQSMGALWWNWEFGDGTSATEQNPTHLYKEYGNYNVCLTAGNGTNQEKFCDSLKIVNNHISAGINGIDFFPNPVPNDGPLYFTLGEDTYHLDMTITDLAGKGIMVREFSEVRKNQSVELEISSLCKGTYLIQSTYNNYRKITKLVVF